jgi:hypothetical protein
MTIVTVFLALGVLAAAAEAHGSRRLGSQIRLGSGEPRSSEMNILLSGER